MDLTEQLNAAMPFGAFLGLEVLSRLDWGDDTFTWRIRRRT